MWMIFTMVVPFLEVSIEFWPIGMDWLSNIDAFLQVVFLAIRHQAQELKEEAVKRKEGEHARMKTMCLCSVPQISLPFL